MKEKNAKNKGITLIALVITIIVLLILAAVSIATLTGENGILTKATKAKTDTQIAEEDEKVKLAIVSAFDDQGNFDQTLFLSELTKQGLSGEKNENGNVVVKTSHTIYTIDGNGKIIDQTSTTPKPEDSWETLASQIDANNYGDFVDYKMDLNGDNNTTNDWKIFYKDETNGRVFLIAADYLDYTKNEDKLNLTENGIGLKKAYEENGKYSLTWDENKLPTVESQKGGIDANLFKATGYDITNHSENANAKCIATLLNTSNWTGFVNQYSDKAIGSPTLQMWVDSWNAKGKIKNIENYTELTTSAGENGYKINADTKFSLGNSGNQDNQTGYYDSLYFPHRDGVNEIQGIGSNGGSGYETATYWLASPSNELNTYLFDVSYNGNIGYGGYGELNRSIRSVVCLKSNIKGNKDTGIWKLAQN